MTRALARWGRGVVEHEEVEALGVLTAEVLEKELKTGTVESGELQPTGVAGGGFNGGVEPIILVERRHDFDGFNPRQPQASPGG
jgi:hypothetical protein